MFESTRHRAQTLWQTIGWLAIAGLIVLSLTPSAAPALGFHYSDKLAHIFAYAVLAWWFAQLSKNKWAVGAGLLALGLVLELAQGMLAYRSADAWDFAADVIGVLIGLGLAKTRAGKFIDWLDARLG